MLGGLRKALSREKLVSRAVGIRKALSAISRSMAIHIVCLCIVFLIAVLLRLMPLRWGFYLSEFDPYFQFRMTEHVVDNGFAAWFGWKDALSWYPWGRVIDRTAFPMLPFTAASFYHFVRFLGFNITVFQLTVVFPVVMGVLTCVALYFFSRSFWGGSVALLSALFLALNLAHISRTGLGFFDDETIGVFAITLFFMFYLKGISPQAKLRSTFVYAVLSGLFLSYLTLGWGTFRYAMDLTVLFSFVLVVLRRYSRQLLLTYGITFSLQLLAATQLPYLGLRFFKEWSTLAILPVFIVLLASETCVHLKALRVRLLAIAGFIGVICVGVFVLWQQGFLINPVAKFITTLDPLTRSELPLVESVAEHRHATWASLFNEFGALTLLGALGFYFASQRLRESDIFIIFFGASSLYFAASLSRLTLIMAPAFSVLAAITVAELGRPSVDILREKVIFARRRVRFAAKVGREYGLAVLLILLVAIMPTFERAVRFSYSPATIVTASTGAYVLPDWTEALVWMRENIPENAVVLSWWDYGYWITTISGKKTLTDNGTLNKTQIAMTALMFLSNETYALPLMKKYDVTHIVIFVTWTSSQQSGIAFRGFGEDGKWYWMAKISNGTTYNGEKIIFIEKRTNVEKQVLISYHRVVKVGEKVISNDTIADNRGLDDISTLGLLSYKGIPASPQFGYNRSSENFDLKFSSSNQFVFVYEVKYPESSSITCSLNSSEITQGQSVDVTGRVVDTSSIGVGNVAVRFQYSSDGGKTWNELDSIIKTDSVGAYRYGWKPNAGAYLVRTCWDGKLPKYLGAYSAVQKLVVK